MSTNEDHTNRANTAAQYDSHSYTNGTNGTTNGNTNDTTVRQDFEKATEGMNQEEKHVALHASRFGYGPLAHIQTNDTDGSLLPGEYCVSFNSHLRDAKAF